MKHCNQWDYNGINHLSTGDSDVFRPRYHVQLGFAEWFLSYLVVARVPLGAMGIRIPFKLWPVRASKSEFPKHVILRFTPLLNPIVLGNL